MKSFRTLLATVILLSLPCASQALDLNPMGVFKYSAREVPTQEVVFKYDDDEVWTIRLPEGGSFASQGPKSLKISPTQAGSSIQVMILPLEGLPADFESKEELEFYGSIVKRSIPEGATDPGPLKRAGGFAANPASKSDSFGLLYNLGGRQFAIAWGFANHTEEGVQLRYMVNAQKQDFEALHDQIRYELSGFRRNTMEYIQKQNGQPLPE